MGHGKLRKFEENKGFSCLLQPASAEVLSDSAPDRGLQLRPHPVRGNWNGGMFPEARPVVVEFGCGRGEYTVELALRNPACNYIGVDIKGARLWKGAKYVTMNGLSNVAFLRTRVEFAEAFFAPEEVSEIWLTFSDPQLKKPHNRLTSPLFLARYRKFLRAGGIVHLKTDSLFLHRYSLEVARQNGLEILACTPDLYGEGRGALYESGIASVCGRAAVDALFEVQTRYERMFLAQGRKITYLAFRPGHEGDYREPVWDEAYWKAAEGGRRTFGHGRTGPDPGEAAFPPEARRGRGTDEGRIKTI